jgi:hypothetical protein
MTFDAIVEIEQKAEVEKRRMSDKLVQHQKQIDAIQSNFQNQNEMILDENKTL